MTTESAEYHMLVNEWAWLRSQVCLLRLEVELCAVLESELGQKWEIRCIKDMYGLRVVSSEKRGLRVDLIIGLSHHTG